jgi:NAD(P)-dependent dehydrogenase (short-subunit alcohol dehydrogenase family)
MGYRALEESCDVILQDAFSTEGRRRRARASFRLATGKSPRRRRRARKHGQSVRPQRPYRARHGSGQRHRPSRRGKACLAGRACSATDLNEPGAFETQELIKKAGGSADAKRFDVTDQAPIDSVAAAVVKDHGAVDSLINNAGICLNAEALETTKKIWDRQMRVNLDAVFCCCRTFGAYMVKQRRGAIVNLSSMAAVIDVHPQDHVGYSVSKAGVAHLSKVLGSEWANTGVRINAIGPGFVATDMPLAAGAEMLAIWKT